MGYWRGSVSWSPASTIPTASPRGSRPPRRVLCGFWHQPAQMLPETIRCPACGRSAEQTARSGSSGSSQASAHVINMYRIAGGGGRHAHLQVPDRAGGAVCPARMNAARVGGSCGRLDADLTLIAWQVQGHTPSCRSRCGSAHGQRCSYAHGIGDPTPDPMLVANQDPVTERSCLRQVVERASSGH